jgi:hypothetical protein
VKPDKDMAAMLDDITKESNNEKYFVNFLQHGGYDVTCNQRIRGGGESDFKCER